VQRALADAGLTLRDVDGFATTGIGGRFDATVMAEYLGLRPAWIDTGPIAACCARSLSLG
jgi:hypothetical protein